MEVVLDEEEVTQIRRSLALLMQMQPLNLQLDKLDFDLDVLRVLVNIQRRRLPKNPAKPNDEGFETMAKVLGVSSTALRDFCHGHSTPHLKIVVRLMAWVGYTDMGEFLTEE